MWVICSSSLVVLTVPRLYDMFISFKTHSWDPSQRQGWRRQATTLDFCARELFCVAGGWGTRGSRQRVEVPSQGDLRARASLLPNSEYKLTSSSSATNRDLINNQSRAQFSRHWLPVWLQVVARDPDLLAIHGSDWGIWHMELCWSDLQLVRPCSVMSPWAK